MTCFPSKFDKKGQKNPIGSLLLSKGSRNIYSVFSSKKGREGEGEERFN